MITFITLKRTQKEQIIKIKAKIKIITKLMKPKTKSKYQKKKNFL